LGDSKKLNDSRVQPAMLLESRAISNPVLHDGSWHSIVEGKLIERLTLVLIEIYLMKQSRNFVSIPAILF